MQFFKQKELYYILIITLFSSLAMGWSAVPGHFFYADDWGQLYYAHFYKYHQLFNIFPVQIYNDRPVGWILIKIIYQIFGLNPVPFHIILLFLHVVNSILVYLITKKLLNSPYWAFLAGIIFGSYIPALRAITWIAAIFDVVVCTLLLITFYLYLFNNLKIVFIGLITYFLAIRSKEIALIFPITLFVYEILSNFRKFNKAIIKEIIRKQLPFLLIMFYFASIYLSLDNYIGPKDPYHLEYTIEEFFIGMEYYLSYFFFKIINIGILPFLYFALIIYGVIRKNSLLLFGLFGIPMALGPVIFLVYHRDDLYLYYPLFYLTIFLVCLLKESQELLIKKWEHIEKILRLALPLLVVLLCLIGIYNSYYSDEANYQYKISVANINNFNYMKKNFHDIAPDTKFFISGLPKYINVFDYLEGFSMKILFNSDSLKVYSNKPEEELKTLYQNSPPPKYFLNWDNGNLKTILKQEN